MEGEVDDVAAWAGVVDDSGGGWWASWLMMVVDGGGGKEGVTWQCLSHGCHIWDATGRGPWGWDIFRLVSYITMPV